MPARLLVTGAGGFVGQHFLAAARAQWPDTRIIAAARAADMPPGGIAGADDFVAFDLLEPTSIDAAIQAVRPDVCVHLAAFSDVAASFSATELVWRANVDGTRALAASLLAHAPDCLLLHAGSADIYGLSFQAGTQLDETACLRPANPYAASKAAADIMLGEMACRGLRVVRMRPVNHVGPGQSPRFAVAAFARQVARVGAGRQPPVIRTGALNRWRDFLDVRDVCAAYLLVVQRYPDLPPAPVFNLASGTSRCLAHVLADLLALAGVTAEIEADASALRPLDVERASCSAALAHVALGWGPRVAWGDTLASVLAYWREA